MSAPKDHKKEMIRLLKETADHQDRYRVFSDCMEMLALTISNHADRTQYQEREARYLELAKNYSRGELEAFGQILAHLQAALHADYQDYLGQVFMESGLGNSDRGQFFTPFEVSQMIAELQFGTELLSTIQERGFATLLEPAAGSGGMVVAAAKVMMGMGVNFQTSCHATCIDIDHKAVHMAYIQISLIGMPAVVIHGDTLRMKEHSRWYTPMHVMGGWSAKLQQNPRAGSACVTTTAAQRALITQEII